MTAAKKAPAKKAAAARPAKQQSTIETRQSINSKGLVRKLESFALGDGTGLTMAQISTIKILLGKTLPDLRQHQIEAAPDTNITISWKK
jgi:hypothetical protein